MPVVYAGDPTRLGCDGIALQQLQGWIVEVALWYEPSVGYLFAYRQLRPIMSK
jgi:hypothetical protein